MIVLRGCGVDAVLAVEVGVAIIHVSLVLFSYSECIEEKVERLTPD